MKRRDFTVYTRALTRAIEVAGSVQVLARFLGSMGVRLGDDFVVDRERRILGTDGLAAVVELFKRGNPVSDPDANPIESGVVLPSARTVDVTRSDPMKGSVPHLLQRFMKTDTASHGWEGATV